MFNPMGASNPQDLGNGGEIDGSLSITGDLTVSGGIGLTLSEVIQGTSTIDVDSTTALVVRKNGAAGDVFIVDTTNSRVGIGATPSRRLESINTNAGADTILLQLRNNSSNASTSSSLRFVNSTSGTATAGGAEISAIRNANDGGSLTIKTAQDSSATLTTALTIDSSQNVGIGILPVASQKLHVNVASNVNFTTSANSSSLRLNAVNDVVDATIPLEINATSTKFLSSVEVNGSGANLKVVSDNNVYLSLDSTQTNGDEWQIFNANDGSTSTLQFKNIDQSALVMLMDENGSVKIGTNASAGSGGAENLIVGSGSGSEGMTIYSGTGDFGSIHFSDSSSSDAGQYRGIIRYGHGGSGEQMEVFANANKRMVIDDNSRISLSNNDSGTSNTVFGKLAGNALASGGNYNLLIGEDAGNDLTTSDHNVAIGFQTLSKATASLDGNTAVGNYAMGSVVSNDVNNCVALGYASMSVGVMEAGASGTVAIGFSALNNVTSGLNVAVGFESGKTITTGTQNTLLGYGAGNDINEGGRNTAVGHLAFGGSLSVHGDESFDNTFIGFGSGAGDWVTAVSNKNTAVGAYSMQGAMNGSLQNTALGYGSLQDLTTGDNNVALGSSSMLNATTASSNVSIGMQSMGSGTVTGDENVAIGKDSLYDITSASGVTAIGAESAYNITSGSESVAIGKQALYTATTVGANTAVGYQALKLNAVASNTAVGHSAGLNTTGTLNTYVGASAGTGAAGAEANNVGVGYSSLNSITTGSQNCSIGSQSGLAITSGIGNVLLGQEAGKGLVGSHNNVIIGREAGSVATATIQTNVIIGYGAGKGALEGGANGMVAVGSSALASLTSGVENTAIGFSSLDANTIGHYNTALGYNSLSANVAGDSNTGIGARALISCNPADGTGYNSSLGFNSGYFITNGEGNTIVGAQSGATGSNNLSTGDNNTLIGKAVGTSIADAQNQTVIGASATGQADNSVTLGNASVTDVYMAQDSGATVHAQKINLDSQTLDLTADFIGIQATYKKTTGTSDNNDDFTALKAVVEFEDDQTIGDVKGAFIASKINTSASGESGSIYGVDILTHQSQYGSIDTNNVFGINAFVDVDGNTVDGDVTGLYLKLDCSNPTGVQEAVYLDMNANADRFLRAFDSANSTARVLISSAGQIDAEGTINQSTALDYAEYFESKDGKEIAVGTTVKLDGNKIVACSDGDTPIGAIRPIGSSSLVGGGQLFHWENKYMKDDYGADIWEDYIITKWIEEVTSEIYLKRDKDETGGVHGGSLRYYKEEPVLYNEDDTLPSDKKVGDVKIDVKYFCEHQYHSDYLPKDVSAPDNAETIKPNTQRQKLNSDFDISKTYKSREERTEWHIVGLLGQIPITKGQPVASNWIKMKDVSDKVEMYFVK